MMNFTVTNFTLCSRHSSISLQSVRVFTRGLLWWSRLVPVREDGLLPVTVKHLLLIYRLRFAKYCCWLGLLASPVWKTSSRHSCIHSLSLSVFLLWVWRSGFSSEIQRCIFGLVQRHTAREWRPCSVLLLHTVETYYVELNSHYWHKQINRHVRFEENRKIQDPTFPTWTVKLQQYVSKYFSWDFFSIKSLHFTRPEPLFSPTVESGFHTFTLSFFQPHQFVRFCSMQGKLMCNWSFL